jgi:Glutamate-cysteine ligase family 2(GCS2)
VASFSYLERVTSLSKLSPQFALELELWIVDLITGKPVSHARRPDGKLVFANEAFVVWIEYLCERGELPSELCEREHFSTEMFSCVVELTTHRVTSKRDFWRKMHLLQEAALLVAAKMRVGLIGGGAHPLANGLQIPILPKPAYEVQVKRWGPLLLYSACTTGLHVHVDREEESDEKSRWVINVMRVFVPLFIALTEDTPFAEGGIAGPRDYRHTLFSAYGNPMTGVPEPMNASEFGSFRKTLIKADLMDENRLKLWAYMLAHPSYPTYEWRVISSPLSWEFTGHVTLLLAALVSKVASYYEGPTYIELPNGGSFDLASAAKTSRADLEIQVQQVLGKGLNTVLEKDFFTGKMGSLQTVSKSFHTLLAWLGADEAIVDALSLEDTLAFFHGILLKGTQVDQQMAFYEQNGGNEAAVRKLITDFLIPEMRKPF